MTEPLRARLTATMAEWRNDQDTCVCVGRDQPCEACMTTARHLGALEAALRAAPAGASRPWFTMCPDCDHGIRGGAPCETCEGAGQVEVVVAARAAVPEDDESRGAVCGWPLAASADQGCTRGNCSQRPLPDRFYAPARARLEYA